MRFQRRIRKFQDSATYAVHDCCSLHLLSSAVRPQNKIGKKAALSLKNTGAEKALSSLEISTTEEELRLYTGTTANVS